MSDIFVLYQVNHDWQASPHPQHIHPRHSRILHPNHGDDDFFLVRLARVQVGAISQRQPASRLSDKDMSCAVEMRRASDTHDLVTNVIQKDAISDRRDISFGYRLLDFTVRPQLYPTNLRSYLQN
jgi:hypothetical protein